MPIITWCFTYMDSGSLLQLAENAPLSMDKEQLIAQLEAAGHKELKFTGYVWHTYAWPGGYPIFYLCADGGVLCPKCANDNIALTTDPDAEKDWRIVASDINYEDDWLFCSHCNKLIESAYGEPHTKDTACD